ADVGVGAAEVAVPLRDLVLGYGGAAAERVPGEVGYEAVVLVPVVAAVGEDEVGLEPLQASLEVILDGGPVEGEVAVPESSDLYLHFGDAFEESGGGGAGLGLARRPAPGEDDPADDDVPPLGEEAEHRPPRPDLEVVGVGAEAEAAERLVRRAAEGEIGRATWRARLERRVGA